MPHIILEHSTNIVEKPDFATLFSRMHSVLMDAGVFKLDDIKSRVHPCETYYLADGNANNAFVHVEFGVFSGRSLEIQNQVGERFMAILAETFNDSLHERNCVVSLEIREMNRETYRKVSGAHASSSGI